MRGGHDAHTIPPTLSANPLVSITSAAYPYEATAAATSSGSAGGASRRASLASRTVAVSARRLTVADATPGTVIAASSTLATHDAQDIPDTLRVTDRSPRSGLRIPSLAPPVAFTRGESSSSSGASRSSTRVGVEPLAVILFDRITLAVYPVSLTRRTSAAAPATPSTVATCFDRSTVASDTPSTLLSACVTQSTQRRQDMPLIARVMIRGLPKSISAGGSSEGVGE
mmetsp:Transcript_5947/g.26318  ORF Transcript_5947/g.26318 Transcript_5947/m.26318 type:complete len:227 (+) Transcript_5947:4374-5054(+)